MDLVSWQLYKPTKESLEQFLQEPTWLTVEVWQHHQKTQAKLINCHGVPIAKLALLLESALSSFGGSQKPIDMSIEKYLFSSEGLGGKGQLNQQTVDIFWDMVKEKSIPGYAMRAIQVNTKLMQELEHKRIT